MTVKELIQKLEALPEEALEAQVWVNVPDSDDGHGPLEAVESGHIWVSTGNPNLRYAETVEPRKPYWNSGGLAVILRGGNS